MTEIHKKFIDNITDTTNRSNNQTFMLLELLEFDYEKLILLEEKIKNNFINYCPSNKEEIEKIFLLKNKSEFYIIDEWIISKPKENKWNLKFINKNGNKHYVAIPPTTGDRIDIISNNKNTNWYYHYNCKSKEHKGIEIRIKSGEIILPLQTKN